MFQLVDRDVCRQVIDPEQRLAQCQCQRLRCGVADQQGSCEARPRSHRDRVDVAEPHPCRAASAFDGRHHGLEVGAARHLGHDSAEPLMLGRTRGNGVGQQRGPPDEPDSRFVARRLDAEDERFGAHP